MSELPSGSRHDPATLMFAYMRVMGTEPDEELRQVENDLHRFAGAQGCLLGGIFHEYQPGSAGVFVEMVGELRRAGVRHVVVPGWDHLSPHRVVREVLIGTLCRQGAQVWAVD